MFTDPITITENGVPITLARISVNTTSAVYQSGDQNFRLEISQQTVSKTQRQRTLVRYTRRKPVTDPLTNVTDYDDFTVSFPLDRPLYGFSSTEIDNAVKALTGFLTTANVTKLLELQF